MNNVQGFFEWAVVATLTLCGAIEWSQFRLRTDSGEMTDSGQTTQLMHLPDALPDHSSDRSLDPFTRSFGRSRARCRDDLMLEVSRPS